MPIDKLPFARPEDVDKFLAQVGDRFFKVVFMKADGTNREMVCRFGVTEYLQGSGKPSPARANKDNVIVFEMNVEGYRCFNKRHIFYLKQGEYEVGAPPKAK